MEKKLSSSRRKFIKSAAAMGSLPFLPPSLSGFSQASGYKSIQSSKLAGVPEEGKSIIGQYGPWAASLAEDPALLSFRRDQWSDPEEWRDKARGKMLELIAPPDMGGELKVSIQKKFVFEGLDIEEMSWHMPYGRPTQAILLKPQGASGPLPAILGLHDHGGNKYLGKRKITRVSGQNPDFVLTHQERAYEGLAWANEIARRGYVVLVHDAFTFGSRRVMYSDVAGIDWGPCNVEGKSDANPEDPANIEIYNIWSAEHEHIMSKSLFCGGTTWPGVFLAEDIRALDVLSSRPDVDPDRIGCGGLSGGGLRTVYLGGADPRIKCAVCAGFMSTWDDFLLNKSFTHTWMTYAPLLPRYLDFPEILGLRVPLPSLILNNSDDDLYTMQGMTRADEILKDIYAKAGAGDQYKCSFYPGPHKMDALMQEEAFDWYDQWLK
jgi:dienelactone hydrolase